MVKSNKEEGVKDEKNCIDIVCKQEKGLSYES